MDLALQKCKVYQKPTTAGVIQFVLQLRDNSSTQIQQNKPLAEYYMFLRAMGGNWAVY